MSENQLLLNAKSVALRKRQFVWFVSNFVVFELFCFLWFPVNNFNTTRYFDSIQHLSALLLFVAFVVYVKQLFTATKGNFGSTSLKIRPFAKGIAVVLANLAFAFVVGRTIYVMVTEPFHNRKTSPFQLNVMALNIDIVPTISAFFALFTIQQNQLVLSEFDATSFHRLYLQQLKIHSLDALKSSVVVATLFATLSTAAKLVLSVFVTYTYSKELQFQSLVCSSVNFTQILLPQDSAWAVFYVSFATVFLVKVVLSVLHDSLCLVEYFPVDFTKLISSVSVKRVASIVSEGEDRRDYRDEKPLVTALSKGLVLPSYSPLYPWLPQQTLVGTNNASTLSSTVSTSGSLSAQRLGESPIPRDRQGQPLYTSSDPNWRIALKLQQHNADLLVQTADYNVLDPPCLPFWGEVPNRVQTALAIDIIRGRTKLPSGESNMNNTVSSEDLLFRSLALQDLRRAASSSSLRRQMIFQKHWAEVAFTLTALVDATALQLHFVDTYINEGVPVDASRSTLSAQYDDTADAQAQSSAMDVDQTTVFESLTTSTDSNGARKPFSVVSELTQFGANITDAANRVHNKQLGGSVVNSAVSSQVAALADKSFYLRGIRSLRELLGLSLKDRSSSLHLNMFPPVMAQSAVNGIDSISLLLVAALSEDASGLVQHHVPSVVNSLLMLEHALLAYSNTVHQTYFSHFSKMGRVQRIQYRVRSIAHLPRSMQLLSVATDEALGRLVGAYRDVLTSCVFVDPLHAKAFQARLDNRNSPRTVAETR